MIFALHAAFLLCILEFAWGIKTYHEITGSITKNLFSYLAVFFLFVVCFGVMFWWINAGLKDASDMVEFVSSAQKILSFLVVWVFVGLFVLACIIGAALDLLSGITNGDSLGTILSSLVSVGGENIQNAFLVMRLLSMLFALTIIPLFLGLYAGALSKSIPLS